MRKGFLMGCVVVMVSVFGGVLGVSPVSASEIKILKTVPGYAEEVKELDNLVISIQFNREMDPEISEDFLLDQRGATDADGNPVHISGVFSWPNPKTLQFKPSNRLKPNAVYQISLFAIIDANGDELDDVPFRSVFTTGSR
ncbi:MAG TPA: Ig-like domain-containing protein [Nitrospiria bacterium]|jgi:hypothetical protein